MEDIIYRVWRACSGRVPVVREPVVEKLLRALRAEVGGTLSGRPVEPGVVILPAMLESSFRRIVQVPGHGNSSAYQAQPAKATPKPIRTRRLALAHTGHPFKDHTKRVREARVADAHHLQRVGHYRQG